MEYRLLENLLVALSVWLTAMPSYVKGNFVYYGPQYLIQANADFRGYTLVPFRDQCGMSAISPADLGKIVWIRLDDGSWYGPCTFVDVGAWHDYYSLVYVKHEIAELGEVQRAMLDFVSIREGVLSVGLCPPGNNSSQPEKYQPPLEWNNSPVYPVSNYPYPKQQMPVDCKFGRQGVFVK